MKVLVIGATGPLGLEITKEALESGHQVTAMVRDPAKLALKDSNLNVVRGDVLRLGDIDLAMAGQTTVVCSLGIKPTREPVTLFSDATEIILRAMQRHNVRRLVCITGIGAGDSTGRGGVADDPTESKLLRTTYEDKTRQEEMVRKSDRDWMIVRPARLTNGRQTRHCGVVTKPQGLGGTTVSRADVAYFIVDNFKTDKYFYKTPALSY